MGELDGKVAVITGAGSGMAKAATEVFVREGAKVLAAVAVTSLALSACAASEDEGSDEATTAATAPITFTWAYEQEFGSFNNGTADTTLAAGH